jgi:hypothetical protein
MPAKIKPNILIVDDQNGQAGIKSLLETGGLAHVTVRHPNEVDDTDLDGKHLLLVDFQLDHWPERDNMDTPSLKPIDGLALAAVLRRHLHTRSCPAAVAIHTGKMVNLTSPLPPEHREHVIARLNNLEWVFKKATPGHENSLAAQLASLAKAVSQLPASWAPASSSEPLGQLLPLLGLRPSDPQVDRIIDDVTSCLPPIHELSEWSHGLAIIRWYLHRILPYPCFLWDTHRLASRLRLSVPDLRQELLPGTPLQKALATCEYKGVLANFLGPRWWRAKIESLLWSKTAGSSSQPAAVQDWINKTSRKALKGLPFTETPVICIDSDYQPLNDFYSVQDAIRIRPDDWPPYADQAWTTRALAAENPSLHALVIREDQEELSRGTG